MGFVAGLGHPTNYDLTTYYIFDGDVGPPCTEGMDVSFIVDYTGSMGSIIESVKTSIAAIAMQIDSLVDPAKVYRLALSLADECWWPDGTTDCTPSYGTKSEYTGLPSAQRLSIDGTHGSYGVHSGNLYDGNELLITCMEVFQNDNQTSFTTQLNKINNNAGNNLPLGFGVMAPEITDLVLWGAIAAAGNGTSHTWYANQGAWRTGVVRLALIFSDASMAGTDDVYSATDVSFQKDIACFAKINETRVCRFGPNSQGTVASLAADVLMCEQTDGEKDPNYSSSAVNNAIMAICLRGNIPYTTTNMTNYSFLLNEDTDGAYLDGGDASYYTMSQASAASRSMSVSFWIKPASGNITSRIYATKGGTSSNGKEWEIGADGSNKLYWKVYDDVNTAFIQIIESSAAVLATGAWQHICCTWDGTVADGNGLIMYHTTAGGVTTTLTNANATASLTGTMDVVGDTGESLLFGLTEGGTVYQGNMADISYWNLELTGVQVALISNSGSQQVNIHSLYSSIDMSKLVGYWRALLGGTNYTDVFGYLNRNLLFRNASSDNWSTDIS